MTIDVEEAGHLFEAFRHADGLEETLAAFHKLCAYLKLDPFNNFKPDFYHKLKQHINTHYAKTLFKLLDKRAAQTEYMEGKACERKKVMIIGGGPCGLRMAIECALLGAQVVVVEKRKYISRNNVLHLWPFVISDLKAIGGKVFFPQFCSGTLNHVSIRTLQLMLLKIALVLGVSVHVPVQFMHLVEPDPSTGKGWRAKVTPENHPLNNYEFDAITGADGKQNTLTEFKRECFRGQLAIGITANFVNYRTRNDAAVEEIGGVYRIFKPELFNLIKEKTGLDLETIVYFKNETHYFVMSVKRQSLLQKGVIKKDCCDTKALLSPDNIDWDRLRECSRQVADVATRHKLPKLDFAKNHHGEHDAAIFDFTAMYKAEYSCYAKERHGKRLLMSIVGDTLLEPFWPTGSGIARGFLGVYDAAWLLRDWCQSPIGSELEVLSRRENVYQLLSQTKPETAVSKYTIDPRTRYGARMKIPSRPPGHVRRLYDTGDRTVCDGIPSSPEPVSPPAKRKRVLDEDELLAWLVETLQPFSPLVKVTDLDKSWRDGLALCALVQAYRPHLIEIQDLEETEALENTCLAYTLVEQEFNIIPIISAQDLVSSHSLDRLAFTSYLAQIQETLESETVAEKNRTTDTRESIQQPPSAMGLLHSLSFRETTRGTPRAALMKSLRHTNRILQESLRGNSATKGPQGSQRDLRRQLVALQKGKSATHGMPSADFMKTSVKGLKRKQDSTSLSREQPSDTATSVTDGQVTEPQRSTSPEPSKYDGRPGPDRKDVMMSISRQACAGAVAGKLALFNQPQPSAAQPRRQVKVLTKMSTPPSDDRDKDTEDTSAQPAESDARTSLQACQGVARARIAAMMKADIPVIPEEPEAEERPYYQKRAPASSDICCICHEKMYIIDRRSDNGYFFHRSCYKCCHCGTLLRFGEAVMQKQRDGSVLFYCLSHGYSVAGLHKVEWDPDLPQENQTQISEEDVIFDSLTTIGPKSMQISEYDTSDSNASEKETTGEEKEEEEKKAEEEEESDPDDDDIDDVVAANYLQSDRKGRRDDSMTSLQLLVADELQHGLEQVATEEEQLQEEGRKVEQSLRESLKGGPRRGKGDDKLMTEWMEVMRRKKELVEKESKLMLQVRLMELKQRHLRLQNQLEMLTNLDDISGNIEELEEDTVVMENEMSELTNQLKDVRMYLKASKDSAA